MVRKELHLAGNERQNVREMHVSNAMIRDREIGHLDRRTVDHDLGCLEMSSRETIYNSKSMWREHKSILFVSEVRRVQH